MRALIPFTVLALMPVLAACERPPEIDRIELTNRAELEAIAGKRIFFGHQSVGGNIIEGINSIASQFGVELNIAEGKGVRALDSPCLLHAVIGVNGDPAGKIRDFSAIIEGGVGAKADIGLMKFCYVDIGPDTDVEALFGEYRDALDRLEAEYPHTLFPRVTVPLTTIERGPKALIKSLLGKSRRGYEDNAARERFNALVRRECSVGKPLFDLALVESTMPDGRLCYVSCRGSEYPALCEEYSSDGGHLNTKGEGLVASRFILFLAAQKSLH